MVYWIFDLDNTLYLTENIKYDAISEDKYLQCLIHGLQGKKFVFTNAHPIHSNAVLKRLGIYHLFTEVVDRIRMNGFKPDMTAFRKFMNISKVDQEDPCVFFEDTVQNLMVGKRLGWTTVLVHPSIRQTQRRQYPFVDYTFRDIQSALETFSFNPEQCRMV